MRPSRLFIVVFIAFVSAPSLFKEAPAAAGETGSETPITLEQCRDQLLSGDFLVVDERKDSKPLPHVARMLAHSVQDMIGRKGTKDESRAEERFDRLHDDVIRKILEERWGIDETSENILDDCYYSLHPEADPAD